MKKAKRGRNEFGKQLKELRTAVGMSQAALGKKLGISSVGISQYETGVNVPREGRKARILAFFGKASEAEAPPVKRKRGRPRKVIVPLATKKDVDQLAGEVLTTLKKPKRMKWGRAKKIAEVIEQKVVVECEEEPRSKAKVDNGRLTAALSPVRLGQVSPAWLEQQTDSFVHCRGMLFIDGQVRIVTMRRVDLIDLGKTLIEACGTKVMP